VVVMNLAERILDPRPSVVAHPQLRSARLGYHEKALVEPNNLIYSDLPCWFGAEHASQLQDGP
jgi:hypothetical protein